MDIHSTHPDKTSFYVVSGYFGDTKIVEKMARYDLCNGINLNSIH